MKYLLDTNVFREVGKQNGHVNVRAWLATVDDADLVISAVTVRELTKGIVKLRSRKPGAAAAVAARVAAVFAALDERILPIDNVVAAMWGEMLAQRDGHVDDAALAATVRVHRLVLVTRNLRHVIDRGVPLLNPFKRPPETIDP